jgi:hypothetical protein
MSSFTSYAQLNSLEEFSFIAGTDFTLVFNVFESDGATPLDIGGATVLWNLCPYGQTDYNILQITGVITGTSQFTVTIPSASTIDLSGKFTQQPVVMAFNGDTYIPGQGTLLILAKIDDP